MRNVFIVFFTLLPFALYGQQSDRKLLYNAISSSEIVKIDNALVAYRKIPQPETEAYLGVLLMKKAGLVKDRREKLTLFKDGHTKLEHAIALDSSKTEFRFFRLMIQEHAPHFLGYYKDIEKDCLFIKNHYRLLSPTIKQFIINYSQTSDALGVLSP